MIKERDTEIIRLKHDLGRQKALVKDLEGRILTVEGDKHLLSQNLANSQAALRLA